MFSSVAHRQQNCYLRAKNAHFKLLLNLLLATYTKISLLN